MINRWDNEICIICLAEINNTVNGQRRFLSARSEYDHRWQVEEKIGKRSTHSLKIRSASKCKESELIKIDCWWPPPSLKKINKTKQKQSWRGLSCLRRCREGAAVHRLDFGAFSLLLWTFSFWDSSADAFWISNDLLWSMNILSKTSTSLFDLTC